jgi:phosphatidylethanolamine/phosphatidyl-N-methylethanolamine N-methyltransferase
MAEPVSAERVERVYERLSARYDFFFERVFQPGREQALSALQLKPGERVLEVGVGTGLVLPLYPHNCQVTGIDLSDGMLDEARERVERLRLRHVSLYRMDAAELEFPDEAFDAVFAPYVVSVVPDPHRVMSEMQRVCRSGGRIAIVNHFLSENPLKAAVEKALSPLAVHFGFHLDTPIETVLRADGLDLLHREKVNLFGNWTLMMLEKRGPEGEPRGYASAAQ